MFRIVQKRVLNDAVVLMEFEAPYIARKAQAGQFIIFRIDEQGERIPLTIADYDRENGTITIIFQIVGKSTQHLSTLNEGDTILDLVGPLGVPTHLDPEVKRVCVVVICNANQTTQGFINIKKLLMRVNLNQKQKEFQK